MLSNTHTSRSIPNPFNSSRILYRAACFCSCYFQLRLLPFGRIILKNLYMIIMVIFYIFMYCILTSMINVPSVAATYSISLNMYNVFKQWWLQIMLNYISVYTCNKLLNKSISKLNWIPISNISVQNSVDPSTSN